MHSVELLALFVVGALAQSRVPPSMTPDATVTLTGSIEDMLSDIAAAATGAAAVSAVASVAAAASASAAITGFTTLAIPTDVPATIILPTEIFGSASAALPTDLPATTVAAPTDLPGTDILSAPLSVILPSANPTDLPSVVVVSLPGDAVTLSIPTDLPATAALSAPISDLVATPTMPSLVVPTSALSSGLLGEAYADAYDDVYGQMKELSNRVTDPSQRAALEATMIEAVDRVSDAVLPALVPPQIPDTATAAMVLTAAKLYVAAIDPPLVFGAIVATLPPAVQDQVMELRSRLVTMRNRILRDQVVSSLNAEDLHSTLRTILELEYTSTDFATSTLTYNFPEATTTNVVTTTVVGEHLRTLTSTIDVQPTDLVKAAGEKLPDCCDLQHEGDKKSGAAGLSSNARTGIISVVITAAACGFLFL